MRDRSRDVTLSPRVSGSAEVGDAGPLSISRRGLGRWARLKNVRVMQITAGPVMAGSNVVDDGETTAAMRSLRGKSRAVVEPMTRP